MRLLIGLLVLASLVALDSTLPGAAGGQPAAFVRVKADTVNLRERPSGKSDRLGQAYENDPLRVLEENGSWLKVRDFEGHEGWVSRQLTDERPTVIVKVPLANIRSGPGTKHAATYTANRGVAFLVRQRKGQWLEVAHADGARGWIYRGLVWGAAEGSDGSGSTPN